MKNVLLILGILISFTGSAQHYYNDIAGAKELGERWKTLTSQKVRSITATGYDDRGAKTTDFNEWQEINAPARTLKITTRNGRIVNRQTYQFDEEDRLVSITDSSGDIKSRTIYSYSNGRLVSVVTNSNDSLKDFSQVIGHYYQYEGSNDKPVKLWRIVNMHDSTEYRFNTDDRKLVIDEQLYRRGVASDLLYYYYNDQGLLSDIVRYDKRTKKLLPTTLFEYDDAGRLIQKMSVISTTRPDYVIWRYIYNDKGLKTKEALFNKNKELTGRIEYAYTFEN